MEQAALILEGGANRGIFTAGVLDFLMDQDFVLPMWWEFLQAPVMRWAMYRNKGAGQGTASWHRMRKKIS